MQAATSSAPGRPAPVAETRPSRAGSSRAYFTTSPSPERSSRSGSVSRARGSASTAAGGWKAPTAFLARGRLTAVLPPSAASTMASSVVGTATHGMPRMKVAARKPAASETAPPPIETTRLRRVSPAASSLPAARSSCASVFPRSPSGSSHHHGDAAGGPERGQRPPRRRGAGHPRAGDHGDAVVRAGQRGERPERAGADVDLVAVLALAGGEDEGRLLHSASRTRVAISSAERPSTAMVRWARR